ncbi:unnamed protein product [[Candida] boidinii]|nr:hypothetical protein B5S30_g1457 [[Candida] boidinii]OWB86499.1 hypothetical protein B5S33_g5198 [[Candida] boidinii]GMF26213.1 unnamed protein product [[Candida] boidinii]GMF58169.1 unnamed protein product [[Candida] boidinii]GMF97712.1 unnamed protein product [[Candida] boidinii]
MSQRISAVFDDIQDVFNRSKVEDETDPEKQPQEDKDQQDDDEPLTETGKRKQGEEEDNEKELASDPVVKRRRTGDGESATDLKHDPVENNRIEGITYELNKLKKINQTMELLNSSFDNTIKNINKMKTTCNNTNQLIDLWSRILMQNKNTRDLINDLHWEGSTKFDDLFLQKFKKIEELNSYLNDLKSKSENLKSNNSNLKRLNEKKLNEKNEILKRRIYGSRNTRR